MRYNEKKHLGVDGKPAHCTYEKELNDRFKYGVVKEEHIDAVMDFLNFDNIVSRLAERDHLELQFKRVKKFDVLHKKKGRARLRMVMNDHASKPVDIQKLKSALKKWIK